MILTQHPEQNIYIVRVELKVEFRKYKHNSGQTFTKESKGG